MKAVATVGRDAAGNDTANDATASSAAEPTATGAANRSAAGPTSTRSAPRTVGATTSATSVEIEHQPCSSAAMSVMSCPA